MARRVAQSVGSGATLSYIDMISGGFGAAFFLFLIFVSFPIEISSTPSNGSRFLDIWVSWEDPEVSVFSVVEFTPAPKGTTMPRALVYSLNSRAMSRDPGTGEVTYSGRAAPFWTDFAEAGYGSGGDRGMRQSDTGHAAQWLRFSDPCPGTYEIFVAGLSPRDRLIELLLENSAPPPVPGRVRVIVSDGGDPVLLPDGDPEGARVEVAFTLGGKPVEVDVGQPIEISGNAGAQGASVLHCEAFD